MKATATIPVFILNLERDHQRRAKMETQLQLLSGFEPRFVLGVRGSALPESVCLKLSQDVAWGQKHKGTLGCFLSHVKAWELIAVINEPFAVVLEDDVEISRLGGLTTLEFPDDADIVFINNRMAPISNEKTPAAYPIWHSLIRLDEASQKGSGGDGYLLTPRGAQKLVDACERDAYFGHVDGRLLRYSVTESDLARLSEDSELKFIIRKHHNQRNMPQLGILNGYSVSPALVHSLFAPSVRSQEDTGLEIGRDVNSSS